MVAIETRIKEIYSIWDYQQRILEIITTAIDKALIFYTQLAGAQVVVAPLINNMETMDLIAPQVTTTDAYEVVHLT